MTLEKKCFAFNSVHGWYVEEVGENVMNSIQFNCTHETLEKKGVSVNSFGWLREKWLRSVQCYVCRLHRRDTRSARG